MNGHERIAQTLKILGITHVYSLSGVPIKSTLPACSKVGIRTIGVRHQQAAVLMAAAHNYRAGRLLAVTIVSAGPAITNAATGILVAWDNCWPLIVIAGTGPKMSRRGTFQVFDGVPVFQTITKWAARISSSSQISDFLTRGFQASTLEQPGPVYLEIPENALQETSSCPIKPFLNSAKPPKLDSTHIAEATRVITEAQRPTVIIGKGARWSEPFNELRRLVEMYQIPFITSPMGRGFLPDDHHLCFNTARDFVQEKADVLLIVGARLNWTFRFGTQFSPDAKVIHIDIAQKELMNDRVGAIGINGDVKHVLQEMLGHMEQQTSEHQGTRARNDWLEHLNTIRQTLTLELEKKIQVPNQPMTPHRLMKEIRDFVPRNAICVLDGRDTMAAAQETLLSFEPATRFTAGSNGCMGVGIPFAIGAKMSAPERLVIVVTGDMAFGISAMEMETAMRHKISIIVIIVNNDGGCATEMHRTLYPPDHEFVARFQPRLSYEKVMEACGGYAESVNRPEEVQPALHRAVTSGLPACINVYVNPQAPFKNYLG